MNEVYSFNLESLGQYADPKKVDYRGQILRHIELRKDETRLHEEFKKVSTNYINKNFPKLADTEIGSMEASGKLGETQYKIVDCLNKMITQLNEAYSQYQRNQAVSQAQHNEICDLVAKFVTRAATLHNVSLPNHAAFKTMDTDDKFKKYKDNLITLCNKAIKYKSGQDNLKSMEVHGLFKQEKTGGNYILTRGARSYALTETTQNLLTRSPSNESPKNSLTRSPSK